MTTPPRVLVIQHAQVEGPARIAGALTDAGGTIEVVRTHLGDPVPDEVCDFDGLVVMGGPMSARGDDGFPTRAAEIALLQEALRAEVPVLGVCLGAQLLALASGGEVLPGHGMEVGWGNVELLADCSDDQLFTGLDNPIEVLHWHGDTYNRPSDAVALASSDAYAQQAFRVGRNAWGLQFHLEVDVADVGRFIDAFPEDARHAKNQAAGIRGRANEAIGQLGPIRDVILARFAALVRQR